MASITLRGNAIHTKGDLPKTGEKAPDFLLTGGDLKDVSLATYAGKKKILNIVPSLDTAVCAQKRFCTTEGLANVVPLSELRSRDFGDAYGARIADGPMAGLLSRAVVVIDEHDKVIYTEQVPEIAQEPDYAKALAAAK